MGGWASAIMGVAGGASNMYGQHEAERDAKRTTIFNVKQYERNAGQAQAVGQRRAEEMRRQGRLLASRAQALAGGSGGDESVVKTISDITAESEFRALTSLYESDVEAQDLRERAKARVFEGERSHRASQYATAGTLFKSGSDLYSKYGGQGSPTMTDRSSFREDDPYRDPNYVGGGEGE